MSQINANIFESLFTFRPRETLVPAENFLTEALVYALTTGTEETRVAWLTLLLGPGASVDPNVHISTREPLALEDKTAFPDVTVKKSINGAPGPAIAVVEHKWGAPYDQGQIKKYLDQISNAHPGRSVPLVFVTADTRDLAKARSAGNVRALLWEDIYRALDGSLKTNGPDRILSDLLQFMKGHGLSPLDPITEAALSELPKDGNANEKKTHPAVERLRGWMGKVAAIEPWNTRVGAFGVSDATESDLPAVTPKLGCVLMEWWPSSQSLHPAALSLGMLYDGKDYGVDLINGSHVDLFLRIEVNPDAHTGVSRSLRERLQPAIDFGEGAKVSNKTPNRHTVLLVQAPLWHVVSGEGETQGQVEAIAKRLRYWCDQIARILTAP